MWIKPGQQGTSALAFPRHTTRTPRLHSTPSSPQQVRVRPVRRAEGSGNQARTSLRTRGKTAPERLPLGRPTRPGRHARHSKAVGGAAARAEHTHMRTHWSDPGRLVGRRLAGTARLSPPALPGAVSTRARPARNGGPGSDKTGRPRTPRAAVLSGSWRSVSPEAQPGGAKAARPVARLGEPGTVPPPPLPEWGANRCAKEMAGAASGPQVTPGRDWRARCQARPPVTGPVNERGAGRNPHTARGEPVASK